MGKYKTIVADPPWPYDGQAVVGTLKRNGRPSINVGLDGKYPPMPIADICAVQPPADAAAHLYLWTTNAFLVEAHEVAAAWGFKQRTCLTWVKVHQDDRARVSSKTGYYFRGATEHCLFCVRGSLRLQISEVRPTAYLWPRLPHSVKPDAFFDLVEECSPGPYLELFARRNRLGWDTWGNESLEHVSVGGR